MAPQRSAKKPHWGCSKCGFATNWAYKPKCHQCGNGAPYKVLARIAEAAANRDTAGEQKDPADAKPQVPSGGDRGGGGEAKLRK